MAKLEVELKNISRVLKDKAADAMERLGGETEDLMKKMKKKGQKTQNEGKKQFGKLVTQMKRSDVFSTASEYYEEVEKALEDRMIKILNFLQIPTKEEMDSLARKVKTLNEKLDTMKKGGARMGNGDRQSKRRAISTHRRGRMVAGSRTSASTTESQKEGITLS